MMMQNKKFVVAALALLAAQALALKRTFSGKAQTIQPTEVEIKDTSKPTTAGGPSLAAKVGAAALVAATDSTTGAANAVLVAGTAKRLLQGSKNDGVANWQTVEADAGGFSGGLSQFTKKPESEEADKENEAQEDGTAETKKTLRSDDGTYGGDVRIGIKDEDEDVYTEVLKALEDIQKGGMDTIKRTLEALEEDQDLKDIKNEVLKMVADFQGKTDPNQEEISNLTKELQSKVKPMVDEVEKVVQGQKQLSPSDREKVVAELEQDNRRTELTNLLSELPGEAMKNVKEFLVFLVKKLNEKAETKPEFYGSAVESLQGFITFLDASKAEEISSGNQNSLDVEDACGPYILKFGAHAVITVLKTIKEKFFKVFFELLQAVTGSFLDKDLLTKEDSIFQFIQKMAESPKFQQLHQKVIDLFAEAQKIFSDANDNKEDATEKLEELQKQLEETLKSSEGPTDEKDFAEASKKQQDEIAEIMKSQAVQKPLQALMNVVQMIMKALKVGLSLMNSAQTLLNKVTGTMNKVASNVQMAAKSFSASQF